MKSVLASYEVAAVPVVWKLRFNPQLNTVHPNTIGIPISTSRTSEGDRLYIDWGDGTQTIVDNNSSEDVFKHTYSADINNVVVSITSNTWPSFSYISDISDGKPIRTEYFNETLIAVENAIPALSRYSMSTYTAIFKDCANLKTVPSDVFINWSNIRNFNSCFNGCSSLESIPAGIFDSHTECTAFYYTFTDCTSLKEIPTGLFDNNTKVTNFSFCFSGCSSLTSIPSGLFDNNKQVTIFVGCFEECSSLISIPVGLFDNNLLATSFTGCFRLCGNLASIPEGLFDNNTEGTTFNQCFTWCYKLANIPSGLFANNTKVTTFQNCFFMSLPENTSLIIGSPSVDNATNFAEDTTVIVPANSTTYDTFTAVAESLNITVQTA